MPDEVPQAVAPDVGPRGGVVFMETRDKTPRDFYIKKTDAEKHGYTRGCAGCSSWFRGLGRQPHTEACRERFRGLMREEAKVQHAAEKRKEFEEKQADKRRRKEERREHKSQRKRKAEEEADDAERAQREDREHDEATGGEAKAGDNNSQAKYGEGERKRKAEEEADDDERATRDEWKDFCAIEEDDAQKWLCELSREHECDYKTKENCKVDDSNLLDPAENWEVDTRTCWTRRRPRSCWTPSKSWRRGRRSWST